MKHQFASFAFSILFFAAVIPASTGQQKQPRHQPVNWQTQIDAVNDAFKNGLMSQADYDARMKQLKSAAALQDAFNHHLLTPQEYETKLQALSGGASAPAPGAVNITSRTRWVEIPDPAWGIVAARFQIPADWNFDGLLIRDHGCGFTPSIVWRISSPDGLYGAQMMPDFGSHWSTNPNAMQSFQQFHCKIMEPLNAEEFLQYVAPLVRPDPQLGPLQPTDDAQQFQESIEGYNQKSRAAFGTSPQSGAAVRSRIQYTYRGQIMEENFAVRLQTFQTRNGIVGGPKFFSWSTNANIRTIRAPRGQLDQVIRILSPLLWAGGYSSTPEWHQRFTQNLQADTAAAMAAQRQQAEATMDTIRASNIAFNNAQNGQFARGQEQWQQHMDYMTRSANAYTLYAGDNQLVRNPQTGVVSTVTNKYGTSAYQQDGTNNIFLQNPNDINPNLYLRGTYTQLENVDPMKPF